MGAVAATAAAAAAAMDEMPGSCSFCDAVVEAEPGLEIGSGSMGAGGGKTLGPGDSILMARNVKGASWHGCSGGGVKAGKGTGGRSSGERVGASLTVEEEIGRRLGSAVCRGSKDGGWVPRTGRILYNG